MKKDKSIGTLDKNHLYIIGYFVLLSILAYLLTGMFADIRYFNDKLPSNFKESWYSFLVFCFGAFYGANFVIAKYDIKKRLQGALILSSSLIVVFIFNYIITYRPHRLIIFFFGLITIAYISYRCRKKEGYLYEYKVATIIATILAGFTIGVALVIYIYGYIHELLPQESMNTLTFLKYSMLTGAFIPVFYKFVNYRVSNVKTFAVGPGKAGKTVLTCGCYEYAKDNDIVSDVPSPDLSNAVNCMRYGFDLFSWGNISENESNEFLNSLKRNLGIKWAENAKILKTDDNKTIRVFTDNNSLEITLDENKEKAILKLYLFSWDELTENDNEREKLIEFLEQNYGIDWVKTAKIEKIDGDKTIRVFSKKNSLSLRLNDEKTKVNLTINDVITDEFIAKTENGKLNILKLYDLLVKNENGRLRVCHERSWPPETTEFRNESFTYVHGDLLVKDVAISVTDFGGQSFQREIKTVVDYLDKKSKNPEKTKPSERITGEVIGDCIYKADRLIFIIDPKRIIESPEVNYVGEYYLPILEKIQRKPYYLVVAKSDMFHNPNWPEKNYYEQLKNKVLDELKKNETFDALIKGAMGTYPVLFFEKNGKPELVNNKFRTVGFDKVLGVLGK